MCELDIEQMKEAFIDPLELKIKKMDEEIKENKIVINSLIEINQQLEKKIKDIDISLRSRLIRYKIEHDYLLKIIKKLFPEEVENLPTKVLKPDEEISLNPVEKNNQKIIDNMFKKIDNNFGYIESEKVLKPINIKRKNEEEYMPRKKII